MKPDLEARAAEMRARMKVKPRRVRGNPRACEDCGGRYYGWAADRFCPACLEPPDPYGHLPRCINPTECLSSSLSGRYSLLL